LEDFIDLPIRDADGIAYRNQAWELNRIASFNIDVSEPNRIRGCSCGRLILKADWQMMVALVKILELVLAYTIDEVMEIVNPSRISVR